MGLVGVGGFGIVAGLAGGVAELFRLANVWTKAVLGHNSASFAVRQNSARIRCR